MIYLKMSGRGGNQFFQYAFVQKYIDEVSPNEILNISFEYLEEKKTDNVSFINVLDQFNVKKINIVDKIDYSFTQKICDIYYRIMYKIIRIYAKLQKRSLNKKDFLNLVKMTQKVLNKNGLYYYIPEMKKFYPSKNNNIIFFGSYEDSSTMLSYRDSILELYKPKKKDVNKRNRFLYEQIINSESVCVTIRRGDFLNDKFKKNYYICDEKYFEKSIDLMNELVSNPRFVVFSDDIEWCKKNMNFPKGTLYETNGNSISEKILLMSSCKHFIISNSTFSWWAQFLGNDISKKIIAPRKWNNFEYCGPIYMDNWYLI